MKRIALVPFFILLFLLVKPVFAQEKNNSGVGYFWVDAKKLDVRGRGWESDSLYYNRLPAHAESKAPKTVWRLSRNTAGFFVQFITDATTIKARWKLTSKNLSMNHFAATGVSGLDLYVKNEKGEWKWLGVGKPSSIANEKTLVKGIPEGERQYMLYLPLYNGIDSLEIGIPDGAAINKVQLPNRKPIVFYGTSITQGGCASRPGMCATAILSRRLNREIINLGFSGSGKMEPELAELLTELDPLVYFIDCLPNLEANEVAERIEPFVRILRNARPNTPIVLAEGVIYNNAYLVEKRHLRNIDSQKALRTAYENLCNKGIRNLYYQVAEGQLGFDGEGTVDGVHPTDLGFMRQADCYQPLLERIIKHCQD